MEKINLTAYKDPKSPISEAYRTIRTNIQFAGVDKPMQVIVVTSAIPHEGKSTVIASLAIVLAQAGKKTLLMDCDFRNPTQHKLFGLENKGTTNYVATVDGQLVAHVAVSTRSRSEARACRLVVMPEWQGAGVGLRFLDAVCELWRTGANRYGRPMPTPQGHPGPTRR